MFYRKTFRLASCKADTDERTIEGVACAYDVEDSYGDVMQRGCFASAKGLLAKGRIKLFSQHWEPVGMITELTDEPDGLYMKAYVSRTLAGDDTLVLADDGVLSDLSVGFLLQESQRKLWPPDAKEDDQHNVRLVTKASLREISPVCWGAVPGSTVTSVSKEHLGYVPAEVPIMDRHHEPDGSVTKDGIAAALDMTLADPNMDEQLFAHLEQHAVDLGLLECTTSDLMKIAASLDKLHRTIAPTEED